MGFGLPRPPWFGRLTTSRRTVGYSLINAEILLAVSEQLKISLMPLPLTAHRIFLP